MTGRSVDRTARAPVRVTKHPGTPEAAKFADDDLLHGPSAGGRLRELQSDAGGRTLTDLPKPAEMTWERFSIETMEGQVGRGGKIRFDLSHVQDVPGVLDGTGRFADTVTGAELRHIRNNWPRFKDSVHFYRGGQEIPKPW